MVKQRLEKDFADVLKGRDELWVQRLYHVAGAYTDVPADFIVLSKDKNCLIECKECRGNSFVFDRLTQLFKLKCFASKGSNFEGYILLCFWRKRRVSSFYWLVPVFRMEQFMANIGKKSANLDDFNQFLADFKIDLKFIYKSFINDRA
jgi:hypothetical protein